MAIVVVLAGLLLPVNSVLSQTLQGAGDRQPITPKTQLEIIDSVTLTLDSFYVFPDKAREMEKFVRKQYKNNAYKDLTDPLAFVLKLAEDLRSITHDGHLGIMYYPADAPELKKPDSLTAEDLKNIEEQAAWDNYGFRKVEILQGNIGYLKFDKFDVAQYGGATAVAALNFLANCDALIIDLRQNGGGETGMIQLISSYFFDNPVHLNSFYVRYSDSLEQYWTSAFVSGPRMSKTDLYVLTSNYTFSAAEEFSNNMKNLKRGTIVGETTGGGAHPVTDASFANLQIVLRVPYGRAINPITGTNWEGVGVKPDIEVPSAQAFDVAYAEALKQSLSKTEDPGRKQLLAWVTEKVESIANPYQLDPVKLNEYVGEYGARIISNENNSLYYQRKDRPKFRLIPMSQDKFFLDGLDTFRIQFTRDASGKITGLRGMYDNGRIDESPKTK